MVVEALYRVVIELVLDNGQESLLVLMAGHSFAKKDCHIHLLPRTKRVLWWQWSHKERSSIMSMVHEQYNSWCVQMV